MTIRKIKNLVLLTLLLAAPGVWAETIDCTAITTLPTVITVQGIYCLTGDLATSMTSGFAIEIRTNNVTIDLNGWKLGGLAAGPGTTTQGIHAVQRKNITIKNGTIRGFLYGIWLTDSIPYTTSQGHLVEDIRADKNTATGIWLMGRGNIVRRNQVVDTGGSTVDGNVFGIQLRGPGVRVLNNDISGTASTASAPAYGLFLADADGAVLEDNRIDNVSSVDGNTYGMGIFSSNNSGVEGNHIADITGGGSTRGIHISSSNNVTVEDNRLYNVLSTTASQSAGLFFSYSNDVLASGNRIASTWVGIGYSSSTGKYMNNLTSSVSAPFNGGSAVGTNN